MNNFEIAKVIEIAENEVGYLEKKSNSDLYDKTGNVGFGNFTKYAYELDKIDGFYNGKKNGYAWCDIFVDWCFVQAYGVDNALNLLCQPKKSTGAGCVYSAEFYKKKGQFFNSPKVGDQIFFYSGGEIGHTGIVYKVENGNVYTIEGNTSSKNGVIDNGGSVEKKSYSINSKYIAGYGRPEYNKEDKKEDETIEKIKNLQKALNSDYNCNLDVDGIVGFYTKNAINNHYLRYFRKGEFVKFVQIELKNKCYDLGTYGIDSCYGYDMVRAVKEFQKNAKIEIDGCVGYETINALLKG